VYPFEIQLSWADDYYPELNPWLRPAARLAYLPLQKFFSLLLAVQPRCWAEPSLVARFIVTHFCFQTNALSLKAYRQSIWFLKEEAKGQVFCRLIAVQSLGMQPRLYDFKVGALLQNPLLLAQTCAHPWIWLRHGDVDLIELLTTPLQSQHLTLLDAASLELQPFPDLLLSWLWPFTYKGFVDVRGFMFLRATSPSEVNTNRINCPSCVCWVTSTTTLLFRAALKLVVQFQRCPNCYLFDALFVRD